MPALVLTRGVAVSLVALSLGQVSLFAMPAGDAVPAATVRTLVSQGNIPGLRKLGTGVLPVMAQLYESAGESDRALGRVSSSFRTACRRSCSCRSRSRGTSWTLRTTSTAARTI